LRAERAHRFGELRRAVPDSSQCMLTWTLRDVLPLVPPGEEYWLTPLGRSLAGPLA
jgi:DNA-binding HxlR family transcriptional regulator